MPRRDDINTILVIGSGPIVIGQACEFDYSGAQACKVLKADGFRIVLVNSNPATIMTDPGLADRTYVEPITPEFLEKVIAAERPDAILPTLGGQTGLNAAVDLARAGVLDKYGVEMIGCDLAAIERGEDRKLFNDCMAELGIETARSGYAYSVEDAINIVEGGRRNSEGHKSECLQNYGSVTAREAAPSPNFAKARISTPSESLRIEGEGGIGYPVVLRPSFTLGGSGGGIAHDRDELVKIVSQGLELSPAGEVLVEESIEGWKEFEMEVMRDRTGNGIIICSIENLDPMGVHTGDSITVAPAQTLSDVEYQRMRVASLAVLEKIGVETGGSNVQFAVNPRDGRMVIIEMNPRVSRSSALASKATGFPIAKAAAKLAAGYTLDEITNDITQATPACFEPTIDYCVVKVPRFAFEKFNGTDDTLTTRMKAVGEIMAIGRTFEEALGKAMRSLEDKHAGLGADGIELNLAQGGEGEGGNTPAASGVLGVHAGVPSEATQPSSTPDMPAETTARGIRNELNSIRQLISRPTSDRIYYLAEALRAGLSVDEVCEATGIDPFFINRIADIVAVQEGLRGLALDALDADTLLLAKQYGLSDVQIAHLCEGDVSELDVRARRKELGVVPAFKTVDTCAAEFASATEYHYKTYDAAESEVGDMESRGGVISSQIYPLLPKMAKAQPGAAVTESFLAQGGEDGCLEPLNDSGGVISSQIYPLLPKMAKAQPGAAVTESFLAQGGEDGCLEPLRPTFPKKKKAMILGAGPNRIGQGIEFDYCCVHASYALSAAGWETIMVNCNPETVSTDYDTSDKLYFEPLTFEDVMDVVDAERPDGVIVTLGGQTPLKLARALEAAGVPIMGTSPEAIDLAEDRDRFAEVLDRLHITYPAAGQASTFEEACAVADQIGFPLLVRPSYVLGGRGMAIVYDAAQLARYMAEAAKISPDHPVYLDRFLEGAVELDLDALCDGTDVFVGGILEHIEMAGIHSGDSACCTPPFSLSDAICARLRQIARELALELGVVGLLNIQFAIKDNVIYVIEANPRASRTVPFVSKATGVPLAKAAARIMAGEKLADLNLPADDRRLEYFCVKEAVMPWGRFPGADVVLGPEMKSTGEVMGIARNFPAGYIKTQLAISYDLPACGKVFISVNDRDKRSIAPIARDVVRLGFDIVATAGTAHTLRACGINCEEIGKLYEGTSDIVSRVAEGDINLIINTPLGSATRDDAFELRAAAVRHGITYVTTLAAAQALLAGMEVAQAGAGLEIVALQDLPQYEI